MASKRIDISYIQKFVKDEYNVDLLSSAYIGRESELKFKDSSGTIFYKSWSSILKHKSCHPNVKISSYREAKEFIESYKNLGYTYLLTPEEYRNQEVKNGNRIYAITHPKLTGTWYTNITDFKRDAYTHLNTSGRSYGELVIKSILVKNGIDFSEQVTILIDGKTHRFDFYIESYNLFIEYDGEQHYSGSTGYYKNKTMDIKNRDKIKDMYVKSIGSRIIRIPYTYSTVEDIAKFMMTSLSINLSIPSKVYTVNDTDISEVYLNNTLSKTASLLGIHETTITRAFKKVYGMTKREHSHLIQK